MVLIDLKQEKLHAGVTMYELVKEDLNLHNHYAYKVESNREREFKMIKKHLVREEDYKKSETWEIESKEFLVEYYRSRYGRRIAYIADVEDPRKQTIYVCNTSAPTMLYNEMVGNTGACYKNKENEKK